MTSEQGKNTNAGNNGYSPANANLLSLGVGVGAAAVGVALHWPRGGSMIAGTRPSR
jgi:hypothetical protein